MPLQQPFQGRPALSVVPNSPSQAPHRIAQPEIHHTDVQAVKDSLGDVWFVCVCLKDGARSLPFSERQDADRWRCPWELAAIEVAANAALFDRLTGADDDVFAGVWKSC
jgi:hypothetical protein